MTGPIQGFFCIINIRILSAFGSSLNLNPHFHNLHIDGVYTFGEDDDLPVFIPAPELKDEDVKTIVETTAHRVIGLLTRRGILEFSLKAPWSDGTCAILLSPLELIESFSVIVQLAAVLQK